MTKYIYACPVNCEQVKRSDSLAKKGGNPEEHSFFKISYIENFTLQHMNQRSLLLLTYIAGDNVWPWRKFWFHFSMFEKAIFSCTFLMKYVHFNLS